MPRRQKSLKNQIVSNVPQGAKLLVAVSGGIDSTVLLHSLNSVKRLLRLDLHIAHVDHGLRPESHSESEFVKKLAEDFTLPFYQFTCGNQPQSGIENWARDQRYTFFAELLKSKSLDWIVTAHHSADVAETLLMRLGSNKEPNSILAIDTQRRCLRPFLRAAKLQITEYAARHKINFMTDSSNFEDTYLRNRVRNQLIPVLKEVFDTSVVESLATRAELLSEDQIFLDQLARKSAETLASLSWGSKDWLINLKFLLKNHSHVVSWRIIECVFSEKCGFSIGYSKAHAILEFIQSNSNSLNLFAGQRLIKDSGELVLVPKLPIQVEQ